MLMQRNKYHPIDVFFQLAAGALDDEVPLIVWLFNIKGKLFAKAATRSDSGYNPFLILIGI